MTHWYSKEYKVDCEDNYIFKKMIIYHKSCHTFLSLLSSALPYKSSHSSKRLLLWTQLGRHFLFNQKVCLFWLKFKSSLSLFSSAGKSHWRRGILKGEVSLYHWPPVWLIRNQLYEYWQFLILFAKQANPDKSNRSSPVHRYFPL